MGKVIGFKVEVLGTKEQVSALRGLQTEIDKLTTRNKALSKEVGGKSTPEFQKNAVALKALRTEHRQAQAAVDKSASGARKLGNSYNDLTARNRVLSGQLRQLSDPLGKNNAEFKRLSSEINRNTNSLKQMDAAMGRQQRNVGNYAEAIQASEKKLKGQRNELQANIRALKIAAQQTSRNSKEQNRIQKELSESQIKYKQVNRELRRFELQQRRGFASINRSIGGLKNLGLALGAGFLGVQALANGLRSSIGVITAFEKSNSELEAVLNGTEEEMTALSDSAKELGATTAFTASEVNGLNLSLAKLGFPTEDILQMNTAILAGASAMGSDLGETATLVGATLKSFGLDASESGRVVDVLAKSTSASALDFAKLNASMSTIAPVANKFGFSVEATTALLGQLSNAGFDASSAATATRNILLNLADSNGKLARSLDKPVTDLPSLVAGLEQLKAEGTDLGEALELTDKRSVAAFATFLDGTDSVLALNETLETASGTAQTMADTQLDNLTGSLTILNSAWEGFILSLDDGDGAFTRAAKATVRLLTDMLSLATGTAKAEDELNEQEKTTRKFTTASIGLGKALATLFIAFVAQRATLVATAVATRAYAAATVALRIAKVVLARGIRGATIAMRGFTVASRASGIGVLVGLVAAAASAFGLYRDKVEDAKDEQKDFNDELERTRGLLDKVNPEDIAGAIVEGSGLAKFALSDLRVALAEFEKQQEQLSESTTVLLAKQGETAEEFAQRRKNALQVEGAELALIISALKERIGVLQNENDHVDNNTKKIEANTVARKDNNKELQDAIKFIVRLGKELRDDFFDEGLEDFTIDKLFDEDAIDKQTERVETKFASDIRNLERSRIEAERDGFKKIEELRDAGFISEIEAIQQQEELKREIRQQSIEAAIQSAQLLSDTIFTIEKQAIERRANEAISVAQRQATTEQKILEERLRDGIISETEFREQKAALDQQQASRERQLKKKQFEENKTLAIVQASINTALAVTQAFASNAFPLSVVVAALAAATGIAQIAIIASQKFKRGGELFPAKEGGIIQGNSHENGGVKFGVGGNIHEAEGGEIIINRRSAQMFKPELSAINQAGGGVAFAPGGEVRRKHQAGVRIPSSVAVPTSRIIQQQQDAVEEATAGVGDLRVTVLESDITGTQNTVGVIESQGTI